ncbi:beta-ketoacyl-ACP synthase II [Desulfosarcina sp. OttesenSCG-928-A07]|nr:beta-ketoacyl-ACP synthase II [Desulfosarcina sp. OttesenSCG-928-G17]MDL2329742.1 beta-ketoacyl-ACP synthase II [Desulfosarcina sp. OttesenSCG-928-A07]
MDRRVVVTGLGLVTPLGVGVDATWTALCKGQSGVGEITRFNTSGFVTRIAAEVKDFNAADFLPQKEANRMERFIAYAVAASRMAVEDARLTIDKTRANRIGVITGCGLGGLEVLETTARTIQEKGPKRVSPFFIPMMIGNMAPGMISIHLGAKGPNISVSTACAAGAHAVGDACNTIRRGQADAMITGGVESVITPTCVAGFNAMKALSTRNDDPERASRPFDRDRDGFVVGEGSGILILEALDHALERGATILAEIVGYGQSGDGYHMTSPSPDGDGMIRCMQAAIDDAGLLPDAIDYINAHGTSTPLNDLYETRAIKAVFGESVRNVAISSTKSMTGHLLGGAGGIESAITVLALKNGIIPPTINLDHPDDECDLDYVPHAARKADLSCAMSNSFGFGGTNASLVFKQYIP